MTKNSVISLKDVSKSFVPEDHDSHTDVVKNVSLEITQGEFVIIFGPSGSGKSTLLHLMAGLEVPTQGEVKFHRRDIAHMDSVQLARYHRKKVGMVFQNFNLIKSLNVWENVALPQVPNRVAPHLRRKHAQHLLDVLGVGDFAHRQPNELSGGQQQRVAIARALINNPRFMVIDEPTGNLDTQSAQEVMDLIHGLHYKSEHTIVLVTHNAEYLKYATRVLHIKDGAIVREERPKHDSSTVDHPLSEAEFKKLAAYKDHDDKDAPGEPV